jgi:amino-acid N-acetyltransferase
VPLPDLLLAPLQRGVIPILLPAAYDASFRAVYADANDIVTALTRLFAGADAVSLDRLIFLDPLGGIPAPDRPAGAHVFVNMEQEYHDISAALEKDGGNPHHLRSLQTLRKSLAMLPPTTSAVITTPASAAATEKAKNPLIHNLLTDKPMFSSSLPTATSPSTQTTVLKHGTPLMLFPSGTRLTDPAIDLKKLVALIEDSFGKRLDVEHYLARVDNNIAGLIIAGDYDGAAIVTWEGKRVCYLDKFAVAKRSQGVGGVADVVFKAMTAGVRKGGLFEGAEGIVWRSRRTNVVNKWVCPRPRGLRRKRCGRHGKG